MGNEPDEEIVRRELDTSTENPAVQVAEKIAELEDEEVTEMKTIYGCIDGVLDHIFSDPPSQEAQLEVEFSYEGYRVTILQDGTAKLVKTSASA